MRLLLALLCLCLSLPTGAAGFDSKARFSQWIAHYYLDPQPDRVADAIAYMSSSGILDDDNARAPMFGFLSGVFRDNPARVEGWVKQADLADERHLAVVVLGAWYSGSKASSDVALEMLESHPRLRPGLALLEGDKPETVEQIPLERGAWVLDALWGKFMATGDGSPVERIVTALPWTDEESDSARAQIGRVARWSLVSNAMQHERVLTICERVERSMTGNAAAKLREVIDEARQKRRKRPLHHVA